MTNYNATVHREGDWWVIEVDGVGVTQAKRLDQVDHMARDLVALMEDVPADSVQITRSVRLGDHAEELRRNHARLRREAEASAQAATGARERLMRELQAAHLSARDIAELTGVSHQRVSQIVGAARDASRMGALAVAAVRGTRAASANTRTTQRSSDGRYVGRDAPKSAVDEAKSSQSHEPKARSVKVGKTRQE